MNPGLVDISGDNGSYPSIMVDHTAYPLINVYINMDMFHGLLWKVGIFK